MYEIDISTRIKIAVISVIFVSTIYTLFMGFSGAFTLGSVIGAVGIQLIDWILWISRNLDRYGVENEKTD